MDKLMQTTITLEIDRALLQKAQAWADQQQITLSEAIANLLQKLPDPEPQTPQPSLTTAFAELQKICQENYVLETPARSDRPNPFPNPESSPPLSSWIQNLTGVISAESLETAQTEYLDYLEEKYT
jgi:hypothetical protein